MHRYFRVAAVATFLCVSFTAIAQSGYVDIEKRLTPEQRRATGLDTLSADQLTLLNTLLRDNEAGRVAEVKAVAKAEAKAEVMAEVEREAAAAPTNTTAGSHLIGLDVEPIHSRLTGEVTGWEPGHVFVLENGQQWKVLKGKMTLSKPLQSPEVLVVPGIAGRWFLQVDEDLPKARVYRID